jgi:hypothetical protein
MLAPCPLPLWVCAVAAAARPRVAVAANAIANAFMGASLTDPSSNNPACRARFQQAVAFSRK